MLALQPRTDIVTRGLRSDGDWDAIGDILEACRIADGHDTVQTALQFRGAVTAVADFDPSVDLRVAETDGRIVGFSYALVDGDNHDFGRILFHGGGVLPAWRGLGIGRRLLAEAQVVARRQSLRRPGPAPATATFRAFLPVTDHATRRLLEADGYTIARYGFTMLRPTLADPPSPDLPPGIEARPATPATALQIARAMAEAMADHWGMPQWTDADLAWLIDHPLWGQLDAWQVAWDGDEVVGGVLGFINEDENLRLGRARGYTEGIFTRRAWRGRGVATALIGRNLRMLAERGMTEASLGVDAQNLTGALALYERCGFQRTHEDLLYQRPA